MSVLTTAEALLHTVAQGSLPVPHQITFEDGQISVTWMLQDKPTQAFQVLKKFEGLWQMHPAADRHDLVLTARTSGMEVTLWAPRDLVDIKIEVKP